MLNASANSTTTKDNCLKNAIAVQSEIFGKENIAKMRNSAPNEQKDLQDYLSVMCFGDFYTRNGLDIKERELVTLCDFGYRWGGRTNASSYGGKFKC